MKKYIIPLLIVSNSAMSQTLDVFLDKKLNPVEIGINGSKFNFVEHSDSSFIRNKDNEHRGVYTYIFEKNGNLQSTYSQGLGECRMGMTFLVKGTWKKLSSNTLSIYMKTQTTNRFHVFEAVYNFKIEDKHLILKKIKLIKDKDVK